MKKLFILIAAAAFICGMSAGKNLTVYNGGYALYSDEIRLDMRQGIHDYMLDDVPETIDTGSITVYPVNLSDKMNILEQNYDYDVTGTSKLLKKKLGKEIEVFANDGKKYSGKLVSTDSGAILLLSGSRLVSIKESEIIRIEFAKSGDVNIRPTLTWKIKSGVQGSKRFKISYLLSGMRWNAKYNLTLDESSGSGMLVSWIQLNNNSGKRFQKTDLQLMAGDIRKAQPSVDYAKRSLAMDMEEAAPMSQEEIMEFHLYSMGRKIDVGPRQKKELPFIDPVKISTKKTLEYQISGYSKNVQVKVTFKNIKDNNLGIPLPAGTVSVYKNDSRGNVQFVGSQEIGHTPSDETVSLYIGDAFDIKGKTETLKREKQGKNRYLTTYKVELRNRKKTGVTVMAKYRRSPSERLIKSDIDPRDKKAVEMVFPVRLEKNQVRTFIFSMLTEY